jgi:hypothetical protein
MFAMTDSDSDVAHGESGPNGGPTGDGTAGDPRNEESGPQAVPTESPMAVPAAVPTATPAPAAAPIPIPIPTPPWGFRLGFGPFAPKRPNDANYSAYMRLKTRPPAGCTFREDYGGARLECRRPGADRLAVIGLLVREIRSVYGLVGTDELGIDRLGEWDPADREWAECTVGQLLLMGASRAEQLGYGVEAVVAFVRDAMAPPLTPRQAAGRSAPTGGSPA